MLTSSLLTSSLLALGIATLMGCSNTPAPNTPATGAQVAQAQAPSTAAGNTDETPPGDPSEEEGITKLPADDANTVVTLGNPPLTAAGRRAITVLNGSRPRAVGTSRGLTTLAVDGPFLLAGLTFPEQIGPYVRGKLTDYGNHDLGYSVGYRSMKGVNTTIYVYGKGGNDVAEMANTLRAIERSYQTVKLLNMRTVNTAVHGRRVAAQYTRVGITVNNHKLVSDSVVMTVQQSFIKLRITGDQAEWANSEDVVETLLSGIGLDLDRA